MVKNCIPNFCQRFQHENTLGITANIGAFCNISCRGSRLKLYEAGISENVFILSSVLWPSLSTSRRCPILVILRLPWFAPVLEVLHGGHDEVVTLLHGEEFYLCDRQGRSVLIIMCNGTSVIVKIQMRQAFKSDKKVGKHRIIKDSKLEVSCSNPFNRCSSENSTIVDIFFPSHDVCRVYHHQ